VCNKIMYWQCCESERGVFFLSELEITVNLFLNSVSDADSNFNLSVLGFGSGLKFYFSVIGFGSGLKF
jgi:hypothetical protein